jgi:hypothetical protein
MPLSQCDSTTQKTHQLSTNLLNSSHSMAKLARILVSIKRDSSESLAMIDPLFAFLISKKVLVPFKKREPSGKARTCFKVTNNWKKVWEDELGYAKNLKQTGRARSLEVVVEEEVENADKNVQPDVQTVKRRKVSVVKHDVAVL